MSGLGWYYTPSQTVNGQEVKARITQDKENLYTVELMIDGVLSGRTLSSNFIEFETACKVGREMIDRLRLDTEPAALEPVFAQPDVFYTAPVTVGNEEIKSRVTRYEGEDGGQHRHIIEVLANGMAITSELQIIRGLDNSHAESLAKYKVTEYAERLNNDLDRNPWDYDEDESRVKKHDRIAELRRRIERNERENADMRYEIEQLLGL